MIGLIFGPPGNGRTRTVYLPGVNAAGFAPLLTFPGKRSTKSYSSPRLGGTLIDASRGRDKPGRPGHAGIDE
jgi:hypothetical protein